MSKFLQDDQVHIPEQRQHNVTIAIGDYDKDFTIHAWNVAQFNRNLPMVGRFIAQPASILFGGILSDALASGTKPDIDMSEALPVALMQLISVMDGDNLNKFLRVMFEDVWVDNLDVSKNLDVIFMEDPLAQFELLAEVLKCNYANFTKKGVLSRLISAAQMSSILQGK